ncbi:MAG: type II secretion system F family protein [Candidatus Schekmanbacteria bacterium]|nr:type II secretion system F family protein [Candidatus Schekmanbacteria bacterium]
MPRYHYEVINAEGIPQEGDLDGVNPETLADSLQKRGFVVLSINAAKGGAAAAAKGFSLGASAARPAVSDVTGKKQNFWEKLNDPGTKGGVKLATLLLFTSQLSSMTGAGLHLLKSLTSLSEDSADRRFQRILQNVRKDVEGGESFSNALARYPKVFSTVYVNLVRAAEATGDLDVILSQLAIYLDKTLTLRRKVKGAMTYPCVILGFATIAILILIAKIVPSFQETFSKLGADLPAATKTLIAISDILRNYLFVLIMAVAGIGFAFWSFIKTKKGAYLLDSLIIKIPIFGPLIWKSILTRFLRTLSILLESGVTVLEAFNLAGQAAGNLYLEKAAKECVVDIRDGRTIHESLETRKIFPAMIIRMVASGEEAGTLPEMLNKVTHYYEQQVETAVDSLSSLIEPILIVVLGTVVGAIIISIFLPIFKLGDAVKGGGKKH